jgi:hypothetical protein
MIRITAARQHRGFYAIAAFVALFSASAPLAVAQVPPLGTCAQWKANRQTWIDKRTNGDLAGMSQAAWQAQLARLDEGILHLCGEAPGNDPTPSASPSLSPEPPTLVPTPGPTSVPTDDQDQPPNPAACLLLSQPEVDAVISAVPNADDPFGFPSPAIAGCDYIPNFPADYTGLQGSLTVIYFLSGGLDVYGGLAAASTVSGVGDQASMYLGADGTGIMFVKGDKAVMLEFHNMNPGDPAVVTLAREAAARVR